MSNYVENNLQNGETVILKAKINFMAIFGQLLWALIVIIINIILLVLRQKDPLGGSNSAVIASQAILLVFGLLPLIIQIIRLSFTVLALTNKRVIGKTGIVAMKSLDIPINKVETVTIQTSFWGRIFKFYTIVIKNASDPIGLRLQGIKNAAEMKNAITSAIEKHEEEARRAQAAEIAMALNKK